MLIGYTLMPTIVAFPIFCLANKYRDVILREYPVKIIAAVFVCSVIITYFIAPTPYLHFHMSRFHSGFIHGYAAIACGVLMMLSLSKLVKRMWIVNYIGRNAMIALGMHELLFTVFRSIDCIGDCYRFHLYLGIALLLPIIWACKRWSPVLAARFDYLRWEEGRLRFWWQKG